MNRHTLKQYIVRWRGLVAIGLITAALFIALNASGLLQILEWRALDRWFKWRPREAVDSRIVIVTIDEADIQGLGAWPMPDRTMIQILKIIAAQQPAAIGLDIYRDVTTDGQESELPRVLQAIPMLIGAEKVAGGQKIAPPPSLAAVGRVGSIDLLLDADGKLRRALLGIGREDGTGEFLLGLGAKTALTALETRSIHLEMADEARSIYRLNRATFVPLSGKEGGYVGRDSGGYQILLNYRGPLECFLHVSLTDVLENRFDPELMRDRIVLIGATAPSLNDLVATPYSNVLRKSPIRMPGIVVHANIASQILSAALDGRPLLQAPGRIFNILWIVLWSAIGVIGNGFLLQTRFLLRNRFLILTITYIGLMGAILFGGSFLAFLAGWVIPCLSPFLTLATAAILTTNDRNRHQLWNANRRLERANQRLEQYSHTLELKVADRTRELSDTLEHLQATQDELIQKEKMAALGQLVAGVAHEVNSPLGAIRSSIENIDNFLVRDLEPLPEFFQQLAPEAQKNFFTLLHRSTVSQTLVLSSRELRQIRRHLTRELETANINDARAIADTLVEMGITETLEPLLPILQGEDGPRLLNAVYRWASVRKSAKTALSATDRAAKVVFALKTYSHYDHSGKKIEANAIEGIETVLTLYHDRLKQGIEVWRDYPKELPLIFCYPDELNQVWTNLIHNAFQAMGSQGKLQIEVRSLEHFLEVAITDSGCGIPEALQGKIFQPFFTTKPSGEGSGLGLDIVKKIVEKHQGTIALSSVPGRTTFSIRLPIHSVQN